MTNILAKHNALHGARGFSLVELMIVVGIIGIMAAMVTSKFRAFAVKAKQAEASTQLSQVFTLSEVYLQENGNYQISGAAIYLANVGTGTCADGNYCNNANNLGFKISTCKARRYNYHFTMPTATTFTAYAREVNTGGPENDACFGTTRQVYVHCAGLPVPGDRWQIDQNRDFKRFGPDPALDPDC